MQFVKSSLIPFLIGAGVCGFIFIAHEYNKPAFLSKWQVIGGYSTEHPTMMGVSVRPLLPNEGATSRVFYIETNAVIILEITDEGKQFSYKYQILTNALHD